MRITSRCLALLACISFLWTTSAPAAETTFEETFKDALYGGAIGALVGGALMAFAKKPIDHAENIGYGAAAGILAGSAYGLAKSARSLAELNNGTIRIAMPTVYPDLQQSPSTGQTTIAWKANLIRGTFN